MNTVKEQVRSWLGMLGDNARGLWVSLTQHIYLIIIIIIITVIIITIIIIIIIIILCL